jgi:hypothetical protein
MGKDRYSPTLLLFVFIYRIPIMKSYQMLISFVALISVIFLNPPHVSAKDKSTPVMFQFMLGKMIIEKDKDQIKGDDFDIFLLGASAQKAYGGTWLKYGIETGGLFNWQSDVRSYVISSDDEGGTVSVGLDINTFLFDYYFGVYTSIEPLKRLRLYLGTGPLLIFGSRTTESAHPDTGAKESTHDSGFGVGGYTRTGLEFIFNDRVIFSMGARHTWTDLSLKDTTGNADIEGWQYFGGLSFRCLRK